MLYDMVLRLSGKISIFGGVLFISKSLLGIESQNCNFFLKA